MRLCSEAGQKVVPQGGLSGAVQGANTTEDEIILSFERMNRVEETNAGGNQVLQYGTAREQLLGLEVVLADGRVLSSMNRMLKNNANYDLKQLFIGSDGTLGLVTRAVLRLRASSPGHATAMVATDDFAKLPKLLRSMQTALGGQMTSFEAMWQSYCRGAFQGSHIGPPPMPPDCPCYLLIESTGSSEESEVARLTAALGDALQEGLITGAVAAKCDAERAALWGIRDNMECLAAFAPWKGFDVSLPISRIESYTESIDRNLRRIFAEPRYIIVGILGDGNLHLVEVSGSISSEHGIGLEKRNILHYCRSEPEIEVMRQLKALFDPWGILNAGKVL